MKIRILSLIAFTLFFVQFLNATHIVGGEFEMIEQRAGSYDIYLNLYFDDQNGNPGAIDPNITATIYRKSDHQLVDHSIQMSIVSDDYVQYENPECYDANLSTRRIRYYTNYQFTTNKYSDPGGYYIVWDRCCRNGVITNIISPGETGMIFYLEFPRMYTNGVKTPYNSPIFKPFYNAYACIGEYFEWDFGAEDFDGDSLRYTMTDPLVGSANTTTPILQIANSGPYSSVFWKSGYSAINAIPGSPELNVNEVTGMLSMIPTGLGLHVFAVKIEEFRNGVKIGEVHRDFQILVKSGCQPNDPPSIDIQNTDGSIYSENDTIHFFTNQNDCLPILISDNLDNRDDKVTVEIVPRNFTDTDNMLPNNAYSFINDNELDSSIVLCSPGCDRIMDEPFIFDLIARDNGCVTPKKDTLTVIFELNPEANNEPVIEYTLQDIFIDTLTGIINSEITTITFSDDERISIKHLAGHELNLTLIGTDVDINDEISIKAIPKGFGFSPQRMEYQFVKNTGGYVETYFKWNPDCDFAENSDKTYFELDFILEDNSCYPDHKDTLTLELELINEFEHPDFYAPNTFSPNGDGVNDLFHFGTIPSSNCLDEYVGFEVYNRWGRKVYETSEDIFYWDGKNVTDGVYFYILKYTETKYKGTIQILR